MSISNPWASASITNPNAPEDKAQPNQVLNAFSDFFNNINNVREDIVDDLEKGLAMLPCAFSG